MSITADTLFSPHSTSCVTDSLSGSSAHEDHFCAVEGILFGPPFGLLFLTAASDLHSPSGHSDGHPMVLSDSFDLLLFRRVSLNFMIFSWSQTNITQVEPLLFSMRRCLRPRPPTAPIILLSSKSGVYVGQTTVGWEVLIRPFSIPGWLASTLLSYWGR